MKTANDRKSQRLARWSFGLLVLSTAVGCKSEETPEQALPAAPVAGAEAEAPPPDAHTLEVRLRPRVAPGAPRRQIELTALAAVLLEGALSDLYGVVPVVEGAPPSPGVSEHLETAVERWTIELQVELSSRDRLAVLLSICSPRAECSEVRADAVGDISPAIAEGMVRLIALLGRSPAAGTVASWSIPQSKDPYAVLLAGRSAASWYGLIPPPKPEQLGDRRLDPVERAIFVDPSMPLAQWIAARSRFAARRFASARISLARASLALPQRLVFLADEAASLTAASQRESAESTWAEILERSPNDPRFVLPYARALLAGGNPDDATRLLDQLPAMFLREAKVLRLRVDIADARGSVRDDALLAQWQEAAPDDPEPVRRRIAAKVRSGKLSEALELVPALSQRGAAEEALELALALEVSLGQLAEAREAARALGLKAVEHALALRIALEQRSAAALSALEDDSDGLETTAAGEALLTAGDGARALQLADRVLQADPWLPEALLLRARALRSLGRGDEASRAAVRVAHADPLLAARAGIRAPPFRGSSPARPAQRPTTAPGKTRSSTQSQRPSP